MEMGQELGRSGMQIHGSGCGWIGRLALAAMAWAAVAAAANDYVVADPSLKAVIVDQVPTESYLGVRLDSEGRLFVGGREGLFVYEPKEGGLYGSRQELLKFPNHTWIYDIEIRGDDLYLSTVSAIYVVPRGRVERKGLVAKRLIWGVPMGHVHQCLHGLAWGPEGDLYFSMGDPLWYYGDFNRPDHWGHWTFFSQPDGTKTPYNGVGGVFRCRPDGSNFQIVARGLRNSCGLCFDSRWNLFTNDNDHEGLPAEYTPGKLVHVVPHGYYNWPRGWMATKTPEQADLLDSILPNMGRAVPVGQAYYDETFLPAKYRNSLLVARWCTRELTFYPLEAAGASFKTAEQVVMTGQNLARPVGVCVGRGGRIFATVSHMAHNEASPVYRSDLVMVTTKDDAPTAPFASDDITRATPDSLWSALSSPSWDDRYRAHVEILRRGGDLLGAAVDRLAALKPGDPAGEHLPWIAAASESEKARLLLEAWANDAKRTSGRLQAVRALAEFAKLEPSPTFFAAKVNDNDPLIQHAALTALFARDGDVPSQVTAGPARSEDRYIRQAAALLLAEKATPEQLAELCHAKDKATRLAGVMAAGLRLTLPPATGAIPAEWPLANHRTEEAYVIDFPEGKTDLRKFGRVGNYTTSEHWKAKKHSAEDEALFALLINELKDAEESVRLQAAHYLSVLDDPRSEPLVASVVKQNNERKLGLAEVNRVFKMWVVGPFPDNGKGFQTIHPPETSAIDLSASYPTPAGPVTWVQPTAKGANGYVMLSDLPNSGDQCSYYAYTRLQCGKNQPVLLLVGSGDGMKIWLNGNPVWEKDVERAALPFQDPIFLTLQPGSNDLLMRVRNRTGDSGVFLSYKTIGDVVAVLPEKLGLGDLAARLREAGSTGGQVQVPEEFFAVDWPKSVAEGDAVMGRKLYSADGLGCAKCHSIKASDAGGHAPSLADAGKRFTIPYLVESVLIPNKQIAPIFKATMVATADGEQLMGLLITETADKIELVLPDATKRTIMKSNIEARKLQDVSPMPHGLVKKPQELRDLIAYMLNPPKE